MITSNKNYFISCLFFLFFLYRLGMLLPLFITVVNGNHRY